MKYNIHFLGRCKFLSLTKHSPQKDCEQILKYHVPLVCSLQHSCGSYQPSLTPACITHCIKQVRSYCTTSQNKLINLMYMISTNSDHILVYKGMNLVWAIKYIIFNFLEDLILRFI